jgi:alpha-tubulin suppressor-like RCC1 family protein
MANRFLSIIASMLVGASAPLSAQGSGPAAQTPAYLKEMPDPERVLADIRGSDEFDTAARQAAAMFLLSDVLLRLSPGWRSASRLTPDEKTLNTRYSRAFSTACDAMIRLRNRPYCNDFNPYFEEPRHMYPTDSFQNEVLTRYLAPATVARFRESMRAGVEELARPQRDAERAAHTFASVTTGSGGHTCALTAEGAAYCWGQNHDGQLGIGTRMNAAVPTAVKGGRRFVSLSVGKTHTCGITTGGATYCWGNIPGAVNTSVCIDQDCPSDSLVTVEGGLKFASLSSGDGYTCGLTAAGAAYCWGSNGSNELGAGTRCYDDPAACAPLTPVPVAGGLRFTAVSAGSDHACGLTPTGRAYCWGSSGSGELGVGSGRIRCSSLVCSGSEAPVPVAGVLRFTSLSAGRAHTCGLTTGGAAYCWGANDFNQIGARTTQGCGIAGVDRISCTLAPVAVAGGLKFTSVSASDVYTCGLTPDGTVYCWGAVERLGAPAPTHCAGRLSYGQQAMCAAAPVAVPVGELKFVLLSTARDHICGIATTGATYCWGANGSGQLGYGTSNDADHPRLIAGPKN